MPNIEKEMVACYKDPKDYHPSEDPKDYVFPDVSKRMLVAKDLVTGNELWMAVHINKMPAKDNFRLKPSYYNSPIKDKQSTVVKAKEIKKDHLLNGLRRNKWWVQTALTIYKNKYRDSLSEELKRKQNEFKSKRAKPARITKPQPRSTKSIKSTKKIKRIKSIKSEQHNSEITELEELLFGHRTGVSASDSKAIAAEIVKASKFKTALPACVLSLMKETMADLEERIRIRELAGDI
ncbi:uncharacterized protein J4E78_003364 [Alternaria triticimaculans]|uniref:uncharacterized protein n=1 Tax=Alternaria triticimaculans TaxID=297637 RepID=UPI0020C47167|nr:uncharacterized protein J4E78_003364 [Alternaria triticimaculans]KAI4665899.1 hypothetical protein J4E78_003364 [Alternaria triticimaculans]